VDYRLAPGTKFPGPAEDCYAAATWAAENAASLGGDATRVAIAGASAGGNLAAAVTLMAKDRGGPSLAHQLMVYPVTDQRMATESYEFFKVGFRLTAESMHAYQDAYLRDEADKQNPYAAPILYEDLSGLPPAHVITAGYDVLRDEGEAYAARLAEAGVPVKATRYEGMIHTFFNAMVGLDGTFEALREAGAELRKAFGTA
jgi:acetyl esterase